MRAGFPAAILSVMILTGCSAPIANTQPSADLHIDRSDVSEIAQRFGCDSMQEIRDDVYFFDPMTGVDCTYSDGTTTMLRVYESRQSPGQVLADWEGYFNESTQLMVGENWFAIGEPSRLLSIAETLGVAPEVSTTLPPAAPITAEQLRVRECSVAVVTITRDSVLGSMSDPKMAPSYEPHFTGIVNFSATVAIAIEESGTFDNTSFEYVIAAYGEQIKRFCSRV